MTEPGRKVKWHCNVCLGKKWHTVLYSIIKDDDDTDEDGNGQEQTVYTLGECNGCEYVALRTVWSINGGYDVENQYPPVLTRRRPEWITELFMADRIDRPGKYHLLQELYASIGLQNWWLTMLGVRSFLELVMIEKVNDNGSFVKNLEKFKDDGFISKVQLDALGPLIEAGHATTHRGYKPTADDVNVVMDILENVLESIYVTTIRADKLKVPPRVKQAAKSKVNP